MASRVYRLLAQRTATWALVLTFAAGWTLVAIAASPANAPLSEEHVNVVVLVFGCLVGIGTVFALFLKWVVEPAISRHNADANAHGIEDLRKGRERNRENIEQIKQTLAAIAVHLDVPKHRLPPAFELASEGEDES